MISIDNEYERSRFEAWAKDNLGQGYPLTCDEGVYENAVTRWAFIAWKAGRRELRDVEMDSTHPYSEGYQAYGNHIDADDNPYEMLSWRYLEWVKGWLKAKQVVVEK